MNIKVSETKDFFVKEGKGFFYLADTIWSAFTHPSLEEWEEYLDYREMQGFNALQINILPQWDASGSGYIFYPFKKDADGKTDYFKYDEAYFTRAQKMMDMAVERGFVPALVVLWCDLVIDTWASNRMPDHIMPMEAVKPYVEHVVKIFSRYDPIYIISGDTNFGSEKAELYYMTALNTIKALCPEALTTMHLAGRSDELPDGFVNSRELDFYMYQSGHGSEQESPYVLAKKFLGKTVERPIVNGEPCYEGHGFGGKYGRFNEFNIRKAIWQSLLSGAKAGITYGAHGIWSWHKKGMAFGSGSFSSTPYEWRTALAFPGAWDAGFAKWIFEAFDLFDLKPCEKLLNSTEEIRMAASDDLKKVVIYAPYSAEIKIGMVLKGYDWTMVNLKERRFAKPRVIWGNEETAIGMPEFNSDILYIGRKV